jgi:hypothetical protein
LRPRERTSTFDLLVVGEINADLLLYGDVSPEFGQAEKLVKDAVLTLSGSSAIVAHGAAGDYRWSPQRHDRLRTRHI